MQSANLNTNTFTRTNYTFAGWNTAADGSGTAYANNASFTMETDGITLYAQWSETVYNITYKPDGTTHPNPATFTFSNLPFFYLQRAKSDILLMAGTIKLILQVW